MNMEKKIFDIMIKEYKEACHDLYETMYGEKLNTEYTIKNKHTGKMVSGSVSGCRMNEKANRVMRTIRKMMIAIYGDQIEETLEKIRKEIRKEEKDFFKENPQFIYYITDVQ